MAEISKLQLQGLQYPLYDFTSSGLTHTWDQPWDEPNSLRVGDLIIKKNYGLIRVDWKKRGPVVTLQSRGHNGALFAEEKIDFTKHQ
jgi:alkaline phosphatase D